MIAMQEDTRQRGGLLIELTVAITVLTVGALAFAGSFSATSRAYDMVNSYETAGSALESAAELMRGEEFTTLLDNYDGATLSVASLTYGGASSTILVNCHVDETAIPAEFGPLTDIDGNAGQNSTDCSMTYQVLPVHLRIEFDTANGIDSRDLYVVLGGGL